MENKLKRALEIKTILDAQKPLYDELEAITLELVDTGLLVETGIPVMVEGCYFTVVDNFAVKNVVWKPAAVRRFELKIQTEEEFVYSKMSKSEKSAFTRAKKKAAA